MKILGISDGHDASACISVDGEIIAATCEERFTRLKSDMDYPIKSIDFCLSYTGIKSRDLDAIALAGDMIFPMHAIFSLLAYLSLMTG